jgi:MFS family permease
MQLNNVVVDEMNAPVGPRPGGARTAIAGLCCIAVLLNCLPSEAFLTKYLKDDKHLSDEQLDNYVWPADTYSTFVFLLPVGFLAEVWGYRSVIALGMLFRELTRMILLFADGLVAMVAMQVTYAASSCVNTIFFAYIYMAVPREDFQKTSALVHAAFHLGNVIGSGLGQILVSFTAVHDNLKVLFYLSWGFITLALIVFIVFLPHPMSPAPPSLVSLLRTTGCKATWRHASELYADRVVVLLSAWWVFATCAYTVLSNYYQVQFSDIDPDGQFGTVEVVIEVMSTLAALLAGVAAVRRAVLRQPFLLFACGSIAAAGLMVLSIWLQSSVLYSYALNISWMAIFAFQQAAAEAVMALRCASPRYAVLFTMATLGALALAAAGQAVGTGLAIDTSGYYWMGAAAEALAAVAMLLYILGDFLAVLDDREGGLVEAA